MKCNKIRYYISLLALSVALSFGGCAANTEENALSYAKAKYGEAEYIGCESSEQGNNYIFSDAEYGFVYYVSSSYGTWLSDFNTAYLSSADVELMSEYDRIQTDYDVKILIPDRSVDCLYFCNIMVDNEEDGKAIAEKLAVAYTSYDTRKWWKDKGMAIVVFNSDRVRLGTFYFDSGKYISKEDSDLSFYTNYIHQNVDDKATYIGKTVVSLDDFATLFNDTVDFSDDGWDVGSAVTVYLFTSGDGQDLFIADAYYYGTPCVGR